MRTLPLLENRKSGGDKVKDFLGEGDYQPTGQGEETLRTLGGIVALERRGRPAPRPSPKG